MAVKKKTRTNTKSKTQMSEVTIYMYSIITIALCLIGILKLGVVGDFLTNIVTFFVGNLYGVFYVIIFIQAIIFAKDKGFHKIALKYYVGYASIFAGWLTLCAVPENTALNGMAVINEFLSNASAIMEGSVASGGGILGACLFGISSILFDRNGTYIIVFLLFLLGLLFILSKQRITAFSNAIVSRFVHMKERVKQKREARALDKEQFVMEEEYEEEEEDSDSHILAYDDHLQSETKIPPIPKTPKSSFLVDVSDIYDEQEVQEEKVVRTQVESDVDTSKYVTDFSKYKLPSARVFAATKTKSKSGANISNAQSAGKRLVEILEHFNVKVTLVDTHIGPSVTKFELRLENGVRVNKISNLQQDIKMGLAAKDIRIEAPIPGKSTVGIEIPNVEKTMVTMKELIKLAPQSLQEEKMLFALGKDLMGEGVFGKMNKMPHLLIAGATGSGKSVCVNTIICSMLLRAKPDEVKMLLIDPKKVEFTQYSKIPHLIAPLITDAEEANRALKVMVKIMDDRYELFAKCAVRNIEGFNSYIDRNPQEQIKKLPYIMVVIDELADLMLVASKEVEASIQRITQLARAAGIHLIVATQRPSVDVITGIIKANIPSRIAFAVSSAIDSRTILDQVGAEKLLGNGDMLYIPVGEQVATRVQGCYVSDEEVISICESCSSQALPRYDDIFLRLDEVDSQAGTVSEFSDPLYEEVRMFVIESQKASTSFIQRKFSIGYARAARLVDMLESHGVIGPSRGSKPREVYGRNDES